jgi:hypothetical protein
MMNIVHDTKTNKSIENSAAAAITAVNLYNPLFSGLNLSNISIPNADLSSSLL